MASMDLDTYKKDLENKSEVPSFAPAVKTQYSRNITVEDWNAVIYSVQGLLSDVSATSEFLLDNTVYQLQYSSTNVRGYTTIDKAKADLENLATSQKVLVRAENGIEVYNVKTIATEEGTTKGFTLLPVAVEANRPYFVYTKANYSPSKEVQSVGTGLVSYFYDEDNKERVVYGTDNVTDGYGFFANVLDASGNYSGAISLGAKTYKFAYDNLVDVFSSDGNTTAIKSPMGSASVELANGDATIKANNTKIELPATGSTFAVGSNFTISKSLTHVAGLAEFKNGAALFYSGVQFYSVAEVFSSPSTYFGIANKSYVDSTAEAQATEKANAEQSRAQDVENYLQTQINAINASQNFVATVSSEADLANIDTSKLEKGVDCVLVLKSTKSGHIDQSVVYQWGTDKAWVFVGELGDYYTKAEIQKQHSQMTAQANLRFATIDSEIKETNTAVSANKLTFDRFVENYELTKEAYEARIPTFYETSSETSESDIIPVMIGLFGATDDETQLSE